MNSYIVATRPSTLAYTQTVQTVKLLKAKNPGCEFEIVKFTTKGDKITDKPLTEFAGTGVFVKELEKAIINGEAHFAIHSLKDVPSIQPEELILASFPKREDPRDVILNRENLDLSQLKDDCIIGTGSPRRIVQIAQEKPNAIFKDLRGNIDSRLRKLNEEQYDAIILAAAGLKRLGIAIPNHSFLSVQTCIPAIGQGAIAIECKANDENTIQLLRSINDAETEIAVKAERSYMLTIGGGCKYPLAAYATMESYMINLYVMIGDDKTNRIIRENNTIIYYGDNPLNQAEQLGKALAEKIKSTALRLGINFES